MGSTIEAIIEAIREAMARLEAKLSALQDAVNRGLRRIARILGALGDWIVDQILTAWNNLLEVVNRFINRMRELTKGGLAPIWFRKRADDWSHFIKAPMIDLAYAVSEDKLVGEDEWAGLGASAYRKAVADQSGAANSVAELAEIMRNSLNACADAGTTFYAMLLAFVVEVVVAVVGGCVAAATGVGAPAGIAAIVVVVGDVFISIATIFKAVTDLLNAKSNQMSEMSSALDSFPGQQWPSAVA